MKDEQLITRYCHRLIAAIEETRKQLLSSSVREAFLRVPRHLFINAYYRGNEQISLRDSLDEERRHSWLNEIYCDGVLITQKDEYGIPTSSSSQPSVMAGMLEALDPTLKDFHKALFRVYYTHKLFLKR